MYIRFNSNGVIDTTFNVNTDTGTSIGEVIVPDYYGKILIGGNESIINDKEPSGNFAKLNQDGTTSSCEESVTYSYYNTLINDDPCIGVYRDIYLGSDGKYYADIGGTYTLMYSVSIFWFLFAFSDIDPFGMPVYYYDRYRINSTSTSLTFDLPIQSPCGGL